MTIVPRFIINLWTGYCLVRFTRRSQSLGRGVAAQQATFNHLMAQFKGTEFGRAHALTATTTYAQYQERVPPRTYHYFAPLIARMAAGEEGVLLPGRVRYFVETAGTTSLAPKLLPVSAPMLHHFRCGLQDALFLYATRSGQRGIFHGRHLHTGTSTALTEDKGAYRTGLDGIFALCLTPWVMANLYAPPPSVAELPAGPEKTTAMVRSVLPQDVTLIGGLPGNICALALAASEGSDGSQTRRPLLTEVWPNLECAAFTGAPLGLFAGTLQALLGSTSKIHEIYAAAEGVFAAQDDGSPPGLRLLTDAGIFFEFLPWAGYNEAQLSHAGAECLPLEKVRTGTDYVLVITTPAGLGRYIPGDVIRFMSLNPPRLEFVGRTVEQLNAFAEHVTARDLLETMRAVCHRNGWQPVNFHVAPYSHRIAAGQSINCHEWWLELLTHPIKTPTANVLGPDLDAELAHRHLKYATLRNDRKLDAPLVRLVAPGTFARWAKAEKKSANESKMPRCRTDRLIADQLAALAQFHDSSGGPGSSTATRPPR